MLFQSFLVTSFAFQTAGMMLRRSHILSGQSKESLLDAPSQQQQQQTCAPLENHQTYFTVKVAVGSPPQNFSVIADTGSDSLIIPSCVCVHAGLCNTGPEQACFQGTGLSSTFEIDDGPEGPGVAVLSFGSGQIKAALASDEVRVGTASTFMKDGVLLMTDQALDISDVFEGILGLGPPQKTAVGEMVPGDASITYDAPSPRSIDEPNSTVSQPRSKSFLKEAGISRFSLCFKAQADGVLRLGTPSQSNELESCGDMHWGVDFQGITVGSSSVPVDFCQTMHKGPAQTTACGGIPDSGTTALAGPLTHLVLLLEGICDDWARCRQLHSEKTEAMIVDPESSLQQDSGTDHLSPSSPVNKSSVFMSLLDDCESWLKNGGSLDELPALKFHVADLSGASQVLTLPPSSYIFQMREADEDGVYSFTNGMREHLQREEGTDPERMVCAPALQPIDYVSETNGPIWILGMPIFEHYQVHYNLHESKPTIAFSGTNCGSCSEEEPTGSLLEASGLEAHVRNSTTSTMKKISKPLRSRSLDPRRPF